MTGTLYLCATPIGNLEDITYRVLRILKEVDLIAAEDTRNSIKLLNHFEIKTPMTSYHEFNKIDKAYQLVAKLKEGKNIALITDAGTPGISDPGEDIVRICYEEGVPVTSLPGPAACITALTMSGRPTRRFAFEAFLPRDKKERAAIIEELKNETTFSELLEYSKEHEPRGEYVLIICGKSRSEVIKEQQQNWETMPLEEHMAYYENQGVDHKEAMKLVAKDRGVSKRDIYQQLLQ